MKNLFLVFVLAFLMSACNHNEVVSNIGFSDEQKIEKITQFYKESLKTNFPQLKINFVEKTSLNGFEAFIFEFEMAGEKSKELIFATENIFFTDAIKFDKLSPLRAEAQTLLSKDKFKIILNHLKEDKDYIISLGSGTKEIFVFSDPECPYCQKHLEKLNEKYLKEYKIHFIFYTIHDNFKIIAGIYKDLKDKYKDEDKLKIIKHYFFENPSYENISEEEIKKAKELFEKYKNLGVLYTPFEIEG